MPDPLRTPGKLNPAVTTATMGQTICVPGWSAMIRPPAAYTSRLKRRQLNAHYQGGTHPVDYEEDHLVPLSLGGHPKDPANLWPEPWPSAIVKDRLEVRLHNLVCDGQLPLAEAQHEIALDWKAAYEKYVGELSDE